MCEIRILIRFVHFCQNNWQPQKNPWPKMWNYLVTLYPLRKGKPFEHDWVESEMMKGGSKRFSWFKIVYFFVCYMYCTGNSFSLKKVKVNYQMTRVIRVIFQTAYSSAYNLLFNLYNCLVSQINRSSYMPQSGIWVAEVTPPVIAKAVIDRKIAFIRTPSL